MPCLRHAHLLKHKSAPRYSARILVWWFLIGYVFVTGLHYLS